MPITSKQKGYLFEVPMRTKGTIAGVALVDQIKSLDWKKRLAEYETQVLSDALQSVRKLLGLFLGLTLG